MSEKLAEALNRYDDSARPIGAEEAVALFDRAGFGMVALPRQVNAATVGRWEGAL